MAVQIDDLNWSVSDWFVSSAALTRPFRAMPSHRADTVFPIQCDARGCLQHKADRSAGDGRVRGKLAPEPEGKDREDV